MTVQTFSAPPSLVPLYAKAAGLGWLHRGDTLPDTQAELAEQTVDLTHLTAYQRLCGFRVSQVLPPTYLHVLAFPVAVALMTERTFPFPLIGLVHVANTITVHRPVTADEAVSFIVRTADLRSQPAGRQFDVLVEARVGDELVWSASSSYLRRGGGSGSSERGLRVAAEPAGSVALVRVPGDIGRKYAALSGDRNPIHLSGLTAKAFGFPRAIAHGMWLEARTLATLEGRLPAALTAAVTFKTPVLLPSSIAIGTSRTADGWELAVGNQRSGKPHLTGLVSPA